MSEARGRTDPRRVARVAPDEVAGDVPTHELMALDAVARLGSLQLAAEALHITPSAVSHRLSSLEIRLGMAVIRRAGRGVVITEPARALVGRIAHHIQSLQRDTERLVASAHQRVRIATAPAIGAAWLIPQLRACVQHLPGLALDLVTVTTAADLPADAWDLLLHYGGAARRGSERRELFRDRLIRVCAPSLRAESAGACEAASPRAVPLLRLSQVEWPGRQGLPPPLADRLTGEVVFDDALAMLEMSAAGGGVAVATETAAAPFLASGRLVRADEGAHEGDDYFLELSESGQRKPAARALFDELQRRAGPASTTRA